MRRLLTVLLLSASTLTAVACGDDDSTGPGDSGVTGTYELQTVNGDPLPFVIAQVGTSFKAEILSGTVTLNSDKTFSFVVKTRTTENGTVTTDEDTTTGTYVRNNNTITFTDASDGSTTAGSLIDDTLTVTAEGVVLVAKKK